MKLLSSLLTPLLGNNVLQGPVAPMRHVSSRAFSSAITTRTTRSDAFLPSSSSSSSSSSSLSLRSDQFNSPPPPPPTRTPWISSLPLLTGSSRQHHRHHHHPQQHAHFSTTSPALARRKKGPIKTDQRITMIRYHLSHPVLPRGLRFSRTRHLRHWTIHRAYMLHRRRTAAERERELERMYNSMRAACEDLRTGVGDGGQLFRKAMDKTGVWAGFPIEYGRFQTEWPGRDGWDHTWKRF